MKEITLIVTGMTCGGCVGSVQRVLAALPGVQSANVTLAPNEARVVYDETRVGRDALARAIIDAGFGVAD